MRRSALSLLVAAGFGLSSVAIFAPAFAQTLPGTDPQTGARPGNEIGTGQSLPFSTKASNINPGDNVTGLPVAPRLPSPDVPPDAPYTAYLKAARSALVTNQTGKAQEALERAQTRLLDRSVPLGKTNQPSTDPRVAVISKALQALGNNDRAGALSAVDDLLRRDAAHTM